MSGDMRPLDRIIALASACYEQNGRFATLEHRGRGVAEEQSLARPARDAEHDQIVAAAFGGLEDRIFGGDIEAERSAYAGVVTVSQLCDVLEHGLLVAAQSGAAPDAAAPFAVGTAACHIKRAHARAAGAG